MPEQEHTKETPPHLSPWKLGGLTPKQLLVRVWNGMSDDDVTGRASQLAYSFFFALFPLLIVLFAILGMMAGAGSHIREALIAHLSSAMPSSAGDLIRHSIDEMSRASGSGKLSFGIVVSLISASAGMIALMDTLNAAYNVRDGRSLVKQYWQAVWLTAVISVLVLAAMTVILYGNTVADGLTGAIGMGDAGAIVWKVVQWPVAIFFLLLTYSLIYYFGPDVEFPKWHWVTPGSAVGVFLWLAASFALRVYLHYFNSYSKTYGSIGAVMILLLWFYVTGLAILIGGEFNVEIENAAAKRGAPSAKEKGQKHPDAPKEPRENAA